MTRTQISLLAAVTALLIAAAPALALIRPAPYTPKSGHHVHRGARPTFFAVDKAKKSRFNTLYISLTHKKRVDKCGKLKNPLDGDGLFQRMYRVKGHRSLYKSKTPRNSFPGWWTVTPGTYYWQVQRTAGSTSITCPDAVSKIRRIVVN